MYCSRFFIFIMNSLLLENYQDQQARLPNSGQHLCAQFAVDDIIVYQAYQPGIADFAVREQFFGGPHYSFSRMTWIKPGFMWMMYRAGWATKPNQERILAIRLKLDGFLAILEAAVHSSFQQAIYQNHENWQTALSNSNVRLQWDPDHDPYGQKLDRRAIQIGLKGEWVQRFNEEWMLEIIDVTDFAKQQYATLSASGMGKLEVPVENVFPLNQYPLIKQRLGAD
jgi:hypothetical protein